MPNSSRPWSGHLHAALLLASSSCLVPTGSAAAAATLPHIIISVIDGAPAHTLTRHYMYVLSLESRSTSNFHRPIPSLPSRSSLQAALTALVRLQILAGPPPCRSLLGENPFSTERSRQTTMQW